MPDGKPLALGSSAVEGKSKTTAEDSKLLQTCGSGANLSLTNTGEKSTAVGFCSFLLCCDAIVNERSSLAGSFDVGHCGRSFALLLGSSEVEVG